MPRATLFPWPDYYDGGADDAQSKTHPAPLYQRGPEDPFHVMPALRKPDPPLKIIDLQGCGGLPVYQDLPAGIVNIGGDQYRRHHYLDVYFHPVRAGKSDPAYFIECLQLIKMIN